MIPKIINYIWFSDNKFSKLEKRCLKTWHKYLPNYTFVKWNIPKINNECNKNNLENPLKVPFVAEALRVQKWAFATDYLRQWVLYNFGGWYFDLDVAINKKFSKRAEEAEKFQFVSCIEYHELDNQADKLLDAKGNPLTKNHIPGFCIQAALLGGESGNEFSKTVLDFYMDKHFNLGNNKQFTDMVAPDICALCARRFGFKYILEDQVLNYKDQHFKIYNSDFCSPTVYSVTSKNVAYHLCEHSWAPPPKEYLRKKNLLLNKYYRKIKGLPAIF